MESVESRREQSKGSASHGGGKVCHRCGWVYPNAHPSKKHRKAHHKQCAAAAPVPSVDADNAAGTVDVGESPCGQRTEEFSLEKSGEALVDVLMLEGVEAENMRSTDRSAGDGEDFKDAVLRNENFDDSPKPSVHHVDMVQNSDAETISSHADDSAYLEIFSVPCVVDSVCTTEDTKCASHSASNYRAFPEVIKDLACATTQNVEDSATAVNYLGNGNYVHDWLDDVIPKELIPSNDSCSNYSLINTELENIEEYMESSVTVNQASEVNMVSDLPYRLSANKMDPDLDVYDAQVMKIEVAAQLSQLQRSCQDGLLGLKSNAGELVDISTHSSGYKYEISTPACFQVDRKNPHSSELTSTTCLVEASDMKPQSLEACRSPCQDGKCSLEKFARELFDISTKLSGLKNQNGIPDHYPVCDTEIEGYHSSTLAATTHPVEDSRWKPGSVEDSSLVEPELTKAYEKGNELASHLADEPSKLGPPKLVVEEFDSNANTFPSTDQINGEFSFHTEKISGNENSDSNNDQICNYVNGDISQLVDELECRVGMPIISFQGPEGKVYPPEILKQVATTGSPVDQAMCLDDQVSSSFETYYLSAEIETSKLDPLWEEQDAYLSCDNNLRVVDSGAVSHISQSSAASLISSQSQNDGNDAIQVSNEVMIEEKTHGTVNDVSSSVDLIADTLPQWYASLPVRPYDNGFGSTKLHNDKLHEDISSSYLCSISDYCLDQSDNPELLEEVFKQPADDEETVDHSERREKTCALEDIVESGHPGDQSTSMHFHEDGTKSSETTSESQMEQQNVHKVQIIDPLSSDENKQNNPIVIVIDRNTPEVEKENTLSSMDNEELTTNECSGVCLCRDGENLKTEKCSVSEVDYVQSLIGIPASGSNLGTSDKASVTSINFNQHPQVEHVFVESMQLTHSSSGKLDDLVASNTKTVSIQAALNTFLDEAAPSFGYGSEGESNDDVKSSSPSDLLTIKELLTTDLKAEANLQQTSVEQNDILEGSLTMLAEPGPKSVSTENTLVHGSKQESEGRNINEENAARVLNSSSGKHVMLKNLLAEAYIDDRQRSSNGRGHIALLTSKRNWGLHDGGHSQRPATAETVPDKCKETFDSQADHGEWNSPARLPVPKHRKKKVKGRQSWVPFICCPSVN